MKYFSEHERSESWDQYSLEESIPDFHFLFLYNEDIFEEKDIQKMNFENLEIKNGIIWGYCTEKGGFSFDNLSAFFPVVANFVFQIPLQEFIGGFFSQELESVKSQGKTLRNIVENVFNHGNVSVSINGQGECFRFVFLKELNGKDFQKAYSAMRNILESNPSPGSYIFNSNNNTWVKFN